MIPASTPANRKRVCGKRIDWSTLRTQSFRLPILRRRRNPPAGNKLPPRTRPPTARRLSKPAAIVATETNSGTLQSRCPSWKKG